MSRELGGYDEDHERQMGMISETPDGAFIDCDALYQPAFA